MPAPKILLEAMASVRPNVVVTVPLLIEKIVRKQVFPKLSSGVAKLARQDSRGQQQDLRRHP